MATNRDFRVKNGLTVDGDITAVNLDISGNVDVDGTLEADAITLNGTSLATSATTDTTNASNIGSGTLATGRLAAALTAQTSMLNTSLVVGRDADNQIKFSTDNQMIFRVGAGDGVTFKASGEIEATSLDISGDVDVDGTLEADAITVNGSALASSATTDTTNASNIGSGTLASGRLPDLAVSDFAASAIVLESEGIGSNDDDDTLPTSAAVKDYVDNNAGGSPGGSDTFVQYNNGGSFGATTLSYDDTAGSEQFKIDVSSSVAPLVLVQTGTGNAFEIHDAADPDSNRFEIDQYGRAAVQGTAGTSGASLYVGGNISSAGRIRGVGATAASPSFATDGDTNTGIFFPAADSIGFSTAGSEILRFGSSGEILIGGSAAGTSGQVLTSGGSGAAVTWEDAGGVSLSGSTNNQLVTVTGSNAIQGESGLTWDGSTLIVSGGTGDAVLSLRADSDNSDEKDQPYMEFVLDGSTTHSSIGHSSDVFHDDSTDNNTLIIANSVATNASGSGIVLKTGEAAGHENAVDALRIYPSGETQARKTMIKAVSSNTTLGDDDSGKTVYWTGGTLTLPATAESGQQFVVINNTNGSATPALGTSNAIATNWTAHAAMADETARTYIAVAANTWIYIG